MRMKKAQAAMEFLMTYGWAILVVLAAIGALAYFGVFNLEKYTPEKCLLGTGMNCQSAKLESSQVQMLITNNLGKTIKMLSINITDMADLTKCNLSMETTVTHTKQSAYTLGGGGAGGTDCSMGTQGDTFQGKILIKYNETSSGFSKTLYGEITQKIE